MIKVLVKTESHYPVDKKRIENTIIKGLALKITRDAEVSVTIVGNRKMRFLNRTYRQKDATTDVLSFPLTESKESVAFIDFPDRILRLGDIVISYPEAVAEAIEENKMVDDMIDFLILHGLDHLLGIHHPE